MTQDTARDNRRRIKHALMILVAFIMMPLNQGCDIAKVMAAIGQLVSAIAAPTTTAGTGTTTPQAGGTTPAVTPAVPQPAANPILRLPTIVGGTQPAAGNGLGIGFGVP